MRSCSHASERDCREMKMEIQARLFFGNLLSLGRSTEASTQCMCIATRYRFPLHSWINLLIPFNKDIVNIPCEVSSFSNVGGMHDIMSIDISDPPEEYLALLSNLQSDTRKEPRHPANIEVDYALIPGERFHKGIVINFSGSGLCIKAHTPLTEEQTIVINSELPNGCKNASVRWVKIMKSGSYMAGLSAVRTPLKTDL